MLKNWNLLAIFALLQICIVSLNDISNTPSSYQSLSPSCQLHVDGGLDIAFKVDGRGEGDVWRHVRCTIDKFLHRHGIANFGGALTGVARVRLADVGSILGADE